MNRDYPHDRISPLAVKIALLTALAAPGCTQQPRPADKTPAPAQPSTRSSVEGASDPISEGTPGSAAFTLMDRSGYLQCFIALHAAAESQVDPQFKQDLTGFFSHYQAQLRPLVDTAKKHPGSLVRLTADAKTIQDSNAPQLDRLAAQPQFSEFGRRVKIVQNELNLLTTQPLLFEGGFNTLGLTQAQRSQIEPLLHQADQALQSQQSGAFTGGNIADLAEQTLTSGLQTRDSIRATLTPDQKNKWDDLATGSPSTQPS